MNPIRVLRRAPFFSATMAACFVIGIGAFAVTLAFARAVLWNPVPLPQSQQLVLIQSYADVAATQGYLTSYESFELLAQHLGGEMPIAAVESPGASASYAMPADAGSQPVNAARASAEIFAVTRAQFLAGRPFSADEAASEAPVLVVGARFAERHFGGVDAAIGATLLLNDIGHHVIGVVPDAQILPFTVDVLIPMDAARYAAGNNHVGSLAVVARRPAGLTVEALDQRLVGVATALAERYPNASTRDAAYRAIPLAAAVVSGIDRSIGAALIAVGLLVLVTLINAGGLVLVRVNQRRQSFVVRSALGASRARLVRTVIDDLAAPTVFGTAAGLLLAWLVVPVLLQLVPVPLPNPDSIKVDAPVAALSLGTAAVMATLLAWFGAWRIARTDDIDVLRQGARGTTRGLKRLLTGLVVAQVAAAVFLAAGSLLLVESFSKVLQSDKGFEPSRVMTLRVTLPASSAQTHASRVQFIDSVRETLASTPGVVSAGAVTDLPIGNAGRGFRFSVDGQPLDDPDAYHRATYRLVTPGYIEALGTRLIEGRLPNAADRADSQPVVVISRFVAETFWPGQSALGQRIKKGGYSAAEPWMTVIGVVDDVRDQFGATGPSLRAPIGLSIYLPIDQYENDRAYSVTVVASSDGAPELLAPLMRARLAALSSLLVMTDSTTMSDLVLASLSRERLMLLLFSFFAGASLLLAAFGIYAVVAYVTQLQDRETGIRIAMGSTRARIAGGYLARGAGMAGIGALAGIGIGVLGLPRLQELLFEVSALDLGVFATSAAIIIAVVLVATAVPAVRAARVNPVEMLRAE